MSAIIHTFSKRLFVAYIACSLAAIFYLPLLVPMPPSVSSSYVFGYNNRVGVMLLLVLVATGAIWTKGLSLRLPTNDDSDRISAKVLAWSLVGVLVGCVTMYSLAGRFNGFGESSYEIDRAWLLSQGKVPYLNFEWPFGVALLYGPLLLRHLFHINLVQAYYLFWIINWLLGTILLYAVVNMVDYPTNSKRSIFFLIYAGGIFSILFTGTHYSFLRFTCPLFFVLVVDKLLSSVAIRSQIYAASLATIFTVVLLLISPETAISYAFACVCMFLISNPVRSARALATFVGLLIALVVVFQATLKLHVLDTIKASSGGADSFPINPAPHILLFFFAVLICACYVFRRISDNRIHDNTIGLIAFSVPMMAAALGRCDPLHVFWNGEGIFLASMFYVAHYKNLWKWYQAVFVLVMVILPDLSSARGYMSFIKTAVTDTMDDSTDTSFIRRSVTYLGKKYVLDRVSTATSAKWREMFEQAQLASPERLSLIDLYPSWRGTYLAPFGYKPDGLGTYLSNQVEYGYFEGFENANTVTATHAKLQELVDHPDKALLLPANFQNGCKEDIPARRSAIVSAFSFPYFGKGVHPNSIRQPVCAYILGHYLNSEKSTSRNFDYGLWIPQPIEASRR